MFFFRSSSFTWRRRNEATCPPPPPPPSCKQESTSEVCARPNEEILPPWTPRSAIEGMVPRPVVVPDDALSSAEPSPARPSPTSAPRWEAEVGDVRHNAIVSARKVDPLPWEASSTEGDPALVAADGSELPSPAPSPLGPSRPNAKFCPVCHSLYSAAVCRCSVLAFNHPIVRIVGQTARSLTPTLEVASRAEGTQSTRESDRVQRALWSSPAEPSTVRASSASPSAPDSAGNAHVCNAPSTDAQRLAGSNAEDEHHTSLQTSNVTPDEQVLHVCVSLSTVQSESVTAAGSSQP